MFRSVLTLAGHCCQFDIPYFKEHTDNQTNFISGLDSTEALDIIVKGQGHNGYSVLYVYDYENRVTLVDSYFSLTPESFFDVNVYVWAIDSSTYVKALPLSGRKCICFQDQGTGGGFHQGCMTRLILKRVVNRCRCLPFGYSSKELDSEEFAKCAWEHYICIYQTIEMIEVDIKDIISDSECYQRCDYVEYSTEVEFVRNQRNFKKLNENNSRVLVHFGQNTCMKYRREVLYTWDQMLANLGGIFGLCLGGSIISVIEIIWFLTEILCSIIASSCRTAVVPKDDDKNKVFVVSQKDMLSKQKSGKRIVGKYKFVH
ncbi:sodium channel protein Nach-like [Helicoverpa zea]|uniref:sodium channel protein Nach-like n=1 Tax=Helicoverpa zea TaxID=7113 RepID=UPI001F58208C|nr:sodium channel protein Nach-like [Helicoverpa zea]